MTVGLRTRAQETFHDLVQEAGIRFFALRGESIAKLLTPAGMRDPYRLYAEVRERGPISRSARFDVWIVSSYATVAAAARDPRLSVDNRLVEGYVPSSDELIQDHEMLLRMDAPDHTRIRRLVGRAFAPRAIAEWRPVVEKVSGELLDAADPSGFDLINDYAVPLTVRVICEVLGVPGHDWPTFRRWGDAATRTLGINVSRGDQRRAQEGMQSLTEYLVAHIAKRRAEPGDDLLSVMIAAEEEGDRLSDRELVANAALILLAGFETTVNLIGNGAAALLDHPDEWKRLLDQPELGANAVDELLRYDSPVQFTGRNVIGDMELGGQQLPKGKQVLVMLAAANNDPDVFDEPRRLDIGRANAGEHVAFSSGPHYCLGASLARLEGEVALRSLVDRFPRLRSAGTSVRRKADLLRGFEAMPVSG